MLRFHDMDARELQVRARLALLTNEERQRIKDNIDMVCFDTYNYDVANHKFCPIAVAMNLHQLIFTSDEDVTERIEERFRPANILKGVKGTFYTNRREDLLSLL